MAAKENQLPIPQLRNSCHRSWHQKQQLQREQLVRVHQLSVIQISDYFGLSLDKPVSLQGRWLGRRSSWPEVKSSCHLTTGSSSKKACADPAPPTRRTGAARWSTVSKTVTCVGSKAKKKMSPKIYAATCANTAIAKIACIRTFLRTVHYCSTFLQQLPCGLSSNILAAISILETSLLDSISQAHVHRTVYTCVHLCTVLLFFILFVLPNTMCHLKHKKKIFIGKKVWKIYDSLKEKYHEIMILSFCLNHLAIRFQ